MVRIGPYQLANKVICAPMAGVTDHTFRELCRRFGAALAVSEMLSSNPLVWQSEKSQNRMGHRQESGIRSVQIAGSDPQQMAEAAQYNVDIGADIIDINTGPVIEGEKSIEQMGEEILEYCIQAASGVIIPKAVQLNQDDFIPWKRGVSL